MWSSSLAVSHNSLTEPGFARGGCVDRAGACDSGFSLSLLRERERDRERQRETGRKTHTEREREREKREREKERKRQAPLCLCGFLPRTFRTVECPKRNRRAETHGSVSALNTHQFVEAVLLSTPVLDFLPRSQHINLRVERQSSRLQRS